LKRKLHFTDVQFATITDVQLATSSLRRREKHNRFKLLRIENHVLLMFSLQHSLHGQESGKAEITAFLNTLNPNSSLTKTFN
jgi:hypothetical protein